jgi:carboxyl-terminal processing protease
LLEKRQQKYKTFKTVTKKNYYISFLLLISILASSCGNNKYVSKEYISTNLSNEKIELSEELFSKLKKDHYIKKFVEEDFNEKYIRALIEKLDENKFFFTQGEVDLFIEKSKNYSGSDFDIDEAYEIINLYFKRLVNFSEYQIRAIEKNSFNFNKEEFMDIYYEDNKWVETSEHLNELWRLQTKNELLVAMIADELSDQPKKDLIKRYTNKIRRIQQQREEDIFSIAMNTLTNQFDPHSSYLSPRSAEDFDMNMSLKLEGIGALLGVKDDYTEIVSLVAGGPAEKSGKILPKDRITKIKQKDLPGSDYVDVIGWRIDEVVDLIRGEAGTEVEIEFISSESGEDIRKLVTLQREEIKLEDRAAKSKVHQIVNGPKIGIIDLPSFYIDFNGYQNKSNDYKSSSGDIKNILNGFNDQNVDAVILDLRNNGGGALMEANKIIGLFVASGPTVQVKHSAGYIQPYGDSRAVQVWKKPLVVMVNRYSASASEIVAGAIQDYQRGLVVGQRTFGKGTVQSLEKLSKGQIKITESKYYRVSGTSTQNKGVVPDIELPVTWDIETVGESSYPTSLKWDTVRPYRHKKFILDSNKLENIKNLYAQRLANEPNLAYLEKVRQRYDLNKNKKELSLNIDIRESEKTLRKEWLLELENERRSLLGLTAFETYADLLEESKDESPEDEDSINIEEDFLLIEVTNIVKDFLNLKIILSKVD